MAAIAFFTMVSCEVTVDNDNERVKFTNEQASQYTITTLQIRNRGPVDAQLEPTEPWGENILKNGLRIAPGEHIYFSLDLPDGHWAEYRLGVDNNWHEKDVILASL